MLWSVNKMGPRTGISDQARNAKAWQQCVRVSAFMPALLKPLAKHQA